MRILILGEFYKPLVPWFKEDLPPQGVPAVYNLYEYLGNHPSLTFHSIIFNSDFNRTKVFPNGSLIELRRIPVPNYYLAKFLGLFWALFYGVRCLRKGQYRLVYGLGTFATIAGMIGRWTGTTSVGRIYGTILTKPLAQRNFVRIYTRHFFDVLTIYYPPQLLIGTFDGTEFDKVACFFNAKAKVELLFNGMEAFLRTNLLSLPVVEIIPKDQPIRIGYIARLEYYKRHHLMLALIQHLIHDYGLNVQLTMLGAGSQKAEILDLIEQMNLDQAVRLVDEIPHQQIPAFIEKQTITGFFYEGGSLGNTIWECALAGRLICTVDNGATGQVFKHRENCLIVPDDEHFVHNMGKAIVDHLGCDISDICTKGRQTVKILVSTWEERFAKEFALIEEKLGPFQ